MNCKCFEESSSLTGQKLRELRAKNPFFELKYAHFEIFGLKSQRKNSFDFLSQKSQNVHI